MSRLYCVTFKKKMKSKWPNVQFLKVFRAHFSRTSFVFCRFLASLRHPLIERSNFLSRLHRFIRDCGKMKYIKFKMAEPSWRMALVPFNNKHEVIMTSLILLKTIYVLANFLILSDTCILGFLVTLR